MEERIKTTITDGVADVRLTRADKMNALDDAMFMALLETGENLKADKSVRAVVISGEGRAFCAGLDMSNFGRMASGERRRTNRRSQAASNSAPMASPTARNMRPCLARHSGAGHRGGSRRRLWRRLQVALGADMRFVAPGTRFSVMEIKWGLVPDMAGMYLMRGLAREDVIRDLTYTGRIFEADAALAYGFATRLCDDPHAEALAVAREIADKSPSAIRAAKRILNDAPDADAAAILLAESVEQDKLIGGAHQKEAIMANLEKRRPNFAG